MINPMKLMQFKSAWDRFQKNHPKFPAFLNAVYRRGIQEGTVIEFHVTSPDGEELTSNFRILADDIALFHELQELAK